jgi:hypothetical protein
MVGNLMDELLSCMGIWLKRTTKQLIAVVEKGIELAEKIILSFAFISIEVDGKMSLELFGGSAGRGFLNFIHI